MSYYEDRREAEQQAERDFERRGRPDYEQMPPEPEEPEPEEPDPLVEAVVEVHSRTYWGMRDDRGKISVGVGSHELDPRNTLVNHSPDGFEWGYAGSGPAQLAMAILADYFGGADDGAALRLHQQFKFEVIAKLPKSAWQITHQQIEDFLAKHK